MHIAPLKARFGGLFHVVALFSARQFWGGHPNTFRSFFAWASLSYAVTMLVHPAAFENRGFDLMRYCAPLGVWAFMFALHWALISFVLHRGASRRLQFAINFFGFAIWTAYVALQDLSLGYPAVNAGMERIAVIYSVWAMWRTGMNRHADRRRVGDA